DPVPVPVIINPVPVVDSGSSTNMYTTTKLNVRSGPSTKYGKIGVLRQGAPVMVLGKTGTWYKINYNGLVGYVCAKYVQQGNATYGGYLTALNKQMMTNAPVTVYKGTGAQYGEMGAFPAGYLAHVVASCGGWYKVVFGNSYGYVQRAYLSDVCYAY
ncbi:MAG: SH3 domain-containing protein, partial [Clostridia bacterium]|nr:SH3 domain-containing protein [Clostridia bacterium]